MKRSLFFQWLLFLCCMMLVIACSEKRKKKHAPLRPPAVSVNVFIVKAAPVFYYDAYPATITALNEVEIRPQVAGYITGVFFVDGQYVKRGQKLYTLDQQQYAGAYEQAVANLNVSKANLAKAQQDADRYEELAKADAIAKQVLDHALADLEAAKKQVEASKAYVNSVQTNLRYTVINAPLSGTIGISQVKLGAAVSPGQSILTTISSDDPVAADMYIDEKDIPRFVQLQKRVPVVKDSTFTLLLPDGSIYSGTGKIILIDRAVDPQTGTLKSRLSFTNPDKILKPGMTCNARVLTHSGQPKIVIPHKAVMEQMGEYFVFVAEKDKAVLKKITPGRILEGTIIVEAGLSAGESLVTEGIQKLKDGVELKIEN